MSKVYGIYQVVDELNSRLKNDRDIKFYVSERRTSLHELKNSGIIDYAKIDKNNVLHVYMIKNFDDLPEKDWRKAIADLPKTLESKMAGKDINTRYSWSKGKYLELNELSADIEAAWGDTENKAPGSMRVAFDKIDTKGINKLYDLKDDQDHMVAADGARAANFIKYINSGPTVVVPKQLWRGMGWSEKAIQMSVTIKYPEAGADILAILRKDFEKVVGAMGFTVTENPEVPMLNKPTSINVETRTSSGIDRQIKDVYADLLNQIRASVEYGNFNREMQALTKRGSQADREQVKKIRTRRDKYESDALAKRLKDPAVVEKLSNLARSQGSDPAKSIIEYHQSIVKENLSIIDSKLVQIKKHPRQGYWVIRSVSGVEIPTY